LDFLDFLGFFLAASGSLGLPVAVSSPAVIVSGQRGTLYSPDIPVFCWDPLVFSDAVKLEADDRLSLSDPHGLRSYADPLDLLFVLVFRTKYAPTVDPVGSLKYACPFSTDTLLDNMF
jgi:hypothetical protein